MTYTDPIFAQLRRLRVEQGWSLDDVERISDGRWKAGLLGTYERGDRNPPLTKLRELLEFYGYQLIALPDGIYTPKDAAVTQ